VSDGGNDLSLRYLPEEHGFDVNNTVITSVGMGYPTILSLVY